MVRIPIRTGGMEIDRQCTAEQAGHVPNLARKTMPQSVCHKIPNGLYSRYLGQQMPQLQAGARKESPLEQMPGSWQDSPIQRKHCKSGTLDAQAQPHRHRAGLLDREVSDLPRHLHTHPPDTRPRIQPNQGCSSQPGCDQLGRVSSRQSICCNNQNSGDPLQTIIMPNDQQ